MASKHTKLADRGARHDAVYRRAKQEGFAGRAVYKLEELDRRFNLLGAGRRVLDLGCWPGSWMQYAARRVGEHGHVVGIDLDPVELALPSWCEAFVGDVNELDPRMLLERFGPFDVVVSDMAPNTIGDSTTDTLRSEALFEQALAIAAVVLRPGGHFAGKVFQGGGFPKLVAQLRALFLQSKPFHTKATRAGSAEHYLVGQGRRPSPPSPPSQSES
jgi:23S rRNA (uridine2552-2'-O)-methyltransferase